MSDPGDDGDPDGAGGTAGTDDAPGSGEPARRLAVTGTPGTGKTSATAALESDHEVLHLNEYVREHDLWTERDADRDGSLVVDLEAVRERLGDREGVVESHLAHHLDADRVAVLRCRPDVLEERLLDRGEPAATARENRESEALDVILGEAVERHGADRVYEIETTDRTPAETAAELAAVAAGERDPSAGGVEFIEYV